MNAQCFPVKLQFAPQLSTDTATNFTLVKRVWIFGDANSTHCFAQRKYRPKMIDFETYNMCCDESRRLEI